MRGKFPLLVSGVIALNLAAVASEPGWRAGVAVSEITPAQALWMSGYGNRVRPADGTMHPLYIKVLALEDAAGRRGIVMSSDLLGIPRSVYNATGAALEEQFGLGRSQVMLHASHSHCTPVLRGALYDAYGAMPVSQHPLIEEYTRELEVAIVETARRAIAALAPAQLAAGEGVSRFAVNRRNNREAEVPKLREEDALRGPADHSVPVLSVRAGGGALQAVVFGYACHNTTLNTYQWSGDYAGFAQLALERNHPGATAMFFSGCGGDQNPLPRRESFLAQRYGEMLAAAVEETLLQPRGTLPPVLQMAHEFLPLELASAPSREELEKMAQAGPGVQPTYSHRWAARLLEELKAGRTLARTYPYPVQAWRLGGKQLWIALGGEVVVDYALRFKGEFGASTWVAGYANDVMAYIPSARILEEDKSPGGGYEGNTSMYVYGMPAHRWSDNIEDSIAEGVHRLVKQVTARSD